MVVPGKKTLWAGLLLSLLLAAVLYQSLDIGSLLTLDKTYASVGYQRPALLGVAQYIRKRLQGRHYNGLPSLGPDHMLIVLGKT